jgi:dTDP-4-dehydrorhamnose reductase
MKVFVLGHRGMLGHVVARYFSEQGMEVLTTDLRYAGLRGDPLIDAVRKSGAEWVINAIGKLDAKTTPPAEMLLVNAQLPAHIKSFLGENQRLIHASTDGVFSGQTGNYAVDTERDATDLYGFSKILGEVVAEQGKAIVIRTSVIGPSIKPKTGLMDWFLSQKQTVNGFTNHVWNGVTTLEWAKFAQRVITGKFVPTGPILHMGSEPPMTKHELLKAISEIWNHRLPITPTKSEKSVNRSLALDVQCASIREQLEELKSWYKGSHSGKNAQL